MKKDGTKLDVVDSMAIREKVDRLLEQRGMKVIDLIRSIPMSKGGYYAMWEAGTVTLGTLVNIARVLSEPAGSLLPDQYRGEVLHVEPGARPFVEQRVDELERKVTYLEKQLTKPKK